MGCNQRRVSDTPFYVSKSDFDPPTFYGISCGLKLFSDEQQFKVIKESPTFTASDVYFKGVRVVIPVPPYELTVKAEGDIPFLCVRFKEADGAECEGGAQMNFEPLLSFGEGPFDFEYEGNRIRYVQYRCKFSKI